MRVMGHGMNTVTSTITRADLSVMAAWGIRLLAWQRLTEPQRIYYRTNVASVLTSKPGNYRDE
jgi:hypothetical protein